jgi:2-oxoglutarate ferredoxin oxidoreductase subunit beta
VLDDPFNPAALALGSGASFVARGFDKDRQFIQSILERAARHKGFAFVEIYTNCVIFNEGAFEEFTSRESRDDKTVVLEHGKPLIFGKNKDKGIRLDGFKPEVVSIADGKYSVDDLLVHDEQDSTLAFILGDMTYNEALPRPVGIFQAIERPTYDYRVDAQIKYEQEKAGDGSIQELMRGTDYWEVKPKS